MVLTMRKQQTFFLVFFLLIHDSMSLLNPGTRVSALQHKLFHDLFQDYDKDAHPAGNATVVVTFGAKLARLVKVEEVNNVVKAQWWMKQSWYNPDLRWNKSTYGNIDVIFVKPTRIWVPDILLYNNGDDRLEVAGGPEKFKTKISISSDGVHNWFAPTIFTSMCKMDIRFFPFDEQFCQLQFGSWSYDNSKINLEIDEKQMRIHRDIYHENNEWKINTLTAKKRLKYYPCCKNPYSDVVITLHILRRSYHYVVNLVFPCAVIACMVFCTFFLPAESGERISLCITVLMAMTIFQELTSEKLPASSDGFILIEMYYTACIVYIAMAIVVTCIVLNFHYRKTRMPQWIKRILLGWLARILGLKSQNTSEIKHNRDLSEVITNSVVTDDSANNKGVALKSINHRNSSSIRENHVKPGNQFNAAALHNEGLGKSQTSVTDECVQEDHTQSPNKDMIERDSTEDWRKAAQVLDRVSMAIGVLVAVVSAAVIFLQAPRVRNYITGRESL